MADQTIPTIKNLRGKIGIGTASPTTNLDVYNSAGWGGLDLDGTSGGELRLQKAGTTYLDIYASDNSSTGSIIKARDHLQLSSGNGTTAATTLFLKNDGKVGIGTVSPARELSVVSSTANAVFQLTNSTAGATADNGLELFASGVDTGVVNRENGYLRFDTNNVERVRILAAGQVGIGTTTAPHTLSVKGTISRLNSSGIQIVNVLASSDHGQVQVLNSGGTERALINSNGNSFFTGGNLGIGTSSPASPLSVVGTARIDGSSGDGVLTIANSAGSQSLRIDQNSLRTTTNNNLTFLTNGNSNSLVLEQANNRVGIGTASPAHKLHVAGDARIEGDLTINGDFTIIDTNTSTTEQMSITNDGTGPALIVNQKGAQPIVHFQDDSNSVFYINNGGAIGMGTSSPEALLHVKAADTVTGTLRIEGGKVDVTSVGEINSEIQFGSNDASVGGDNIGGKISSVTEYNNGAFVGLAFYTYYQGQSPALAEHMRLTMDGRLGIGTTSPDAPLNVSGSVSDIVAQFRDGSDGVHIATRGSSRQQIDFNGTNTSSINAKGSLFINYDSDNNGSNDTITFGRNRTDESGGSTDMVITEGKVGVGTTTPAALLDIVDSQTLSGSLMSTTVLTTTTLTATSSQTGGYKIQDYFNLTGTGGSFTNTAHQQVMTTVSSTGTGTYLKNHVSRVHTSGSGQIHSVAHYNTHTELGGNGTITNWIGYAVADGIMSSFENSGHTITNTYGLYIGDLTHGTQTNTPFGVYQLNTDMLNYFGGKVGIATTTPAAPLHVKGQVRIERSNATAYGTIDTYGNYRFGAPAGYHFTFHNTNPDAGGEIVRINSNGNVGIGTAAPATKLQIDQYTVGSNGNQYDSGTASIFTNSGSEALYLGVKNASYPNRGYSFKVTNNGVNSDFTIKEHGLTGDRFTIQTGGNVGIGTTSPDAFLHVSKDNDNSGNQFCVADTEGVSPAVRTYTHGGSPAGLILNHYYAVGGSSNEYMRYADFVANIGNGAGTTMRFITKNAANTYSTTVIDNDGKVGIGTTSPAEKLEVKGNVLLKNGTTATKINLYETYTDAYNYEKTSLEHNSGYFRINPNVGGSGTQSGIDLAIGGASKLKIEPTGHVLIPDDVILKIGSGSDLQLQHSSNHSYIENSTGHLYINNHGENKMVYFRADDGTGSGITEYFRVDGSANQVIYSMPVTLADDKYLSLGTNNDLQIKHDGSNSYINQTGTGDLHIRQTIADKSIFLSADNGSGTATTYFQLNGASGNVTFSKEIRLLDGVQLQLGAGNDMQITHNGANGFITNNKGDLTIKSSEADKDIIFQADDGTGGGNVETYFRLDGSYSDVSGSGPKTIFPDNSILALGTHADLRLLHDGVHGYVFYGGPNNLQISGNSVILIGYNDGSAYGETAMTMTKNGAVTIRHDNSTKFSTTSTGVNITGALVADTINCEGELNFTGGGHKYIDIETLASSNTLTIRHHNPSGNLFETAASFTANGGASLHYNNGVRLSTTTDGISLSGNGYLDMPDNGRIRMGEHFDFAIYHDGSNNWLASANGRNLMIQSNGLALRSEAQEPYINCTANGAVDIYHDGTTSLATVVGGIKVNSTMLQRSSLVNFANSTANQKVDLYWTGTQVFWGEILVTVTGTYSNQNNAGSITKKFYVGLNASNSVFTNESRYTDTGGVTADNFAISDLRWDSTNSRYYITVVHRVSTGNQIGIKVEAFAKDHAHISNIDDITTGSVYTTDTTAYDKPYVQYNDDVKFFGATSGFYLLWDESANALKGRYDLKIEENREIQLGGSNELRFYHLTNNSYIKHNDASGSLYISGSTQVNIGGANGQNGIQYIEGGAVRLRHNNVVKLDTTSTGIAVTGGVVSQIPINAETASYTLVLGDQGGLVEVTSSSATTVTIPPQSSVAYETGTQIIVQRQGTGAVTIVAGSGVTAQSANNQLKIRARYGACVLIKKASDTWAVIGDMDS